MLTRTTSVTMTSPSIPIEPPWNPVRITIKKTDTIHRWHPTNHRIISRAFRSDVQIGFWIPPAEYIHDTKHRISEGHHLLHRVKHLGIKTMSFVYPLWSLSRFQSMFRICPNGVWRLSQSYHIPLDLFVGQRLNSPKKKYSHICSSSVQCWLKTSSPDLDNLGSPCSQWSGQIEWLESQGEGRVLRRRRHGRRSALMTQPDP